MKFFVTMTASAEREVEVEADTPEEAIKSAKLLVKKLSGTARPEAVVHVDEEKPTAEKETLWRLVGFCEGCAHPILAKSLGNGHETGDRYGYDDDGIYTCSTCLELIEADATSGAP